MKIKLILIGAVLSLNSCASLPSFLTEAKTKRSVKTTAYTHNERDHTKYGKSTAIGTILRDGVCATDWSVFPVGTKLLINGKEYEVEDYGRALVGKDTPVVDIYRPSFASMNKWGARWYDIQVVEWGDWEKSKKILSTRLKYKHCREMYNNI